MYGKYGQIFLFPMTRGKKRRVCQTTHDNRQNFRRCRAENTIMAKSLVPSTLITLICFSILFAVRGQSGMQKEPEDDNYMPAKGDTDEQPEIKPEENLGEAGSEQYETDEDIVDPSRDDEGTEEQMSENSGEDDREKSQTEEDSNIFEDESTTMQSGDNERTDVLSSDEKGIDEQSSDEELENNTMLPEDTYSQYDENVYTTEYRSTDPQYTPTFQGVEVTDIPNNDNGNERTYGEESTGVQNQDNKGSERVNPPPYWQTWWGYPNYPGNNGPFNTGSNGPFNRGSNIPFYPGSNGALIPGSNGPFNPGSNGPFSPEGVLQAWFQQGNTGVPPLGWPFQPGQFGRPTAQGPYQSGQLGGQTAQGPYQPGELGGPTAQGYHPGQFGGPIAQGPYQPGQLGGPTAQGPYQPGQFGGPTAQGPYQPGQLGGPTAQGPYQQGSGPYSPGSIPGGFLPPNGVQRWGHWWGFAPYLSYMPGGQPPRQPSQGGDAQEKQDSRK